MSLKKRDALTVTCDQLDAQMRWLQTEGFPFVTAGQVIAGVRGESMLPPDPVLVTFDDAYLDTYALAHPILRRLGIPAVVFVPTAYVGGAGAWDADPQPLMNAAQLQQLADSGWELGLHSHQHLNYRTLGGEEIAGDIRAGGQAFRRLALPAAPAFAYPFGGRPPGAEAQRRLHVAFAAAGIRLAFRIGNRVNRLPLRDVFEINRLGVRGDRDLAFFRRQVWWGRWF